MRCTELQKSTQVPLDLSGKASSKDADCAHLESTGVHGDLQDCQVIIGGCGDTNAGQVVAQGAGGHPPDAVLQISLAAQAHRLRHALQCSRLLPQDLDCCCCKCLPPKHETHQPNKCCSSIIHSWQECHFAEVSFIKQMAPPTLPASRGLGKGRRRPQALSLTGEHLRQPLRHLLSNFV